MKTVFTRLSALALAAALPLLFATGAFAKDDPKFKTTKPVVQIAILLDTSNSMDGLIAQAKSQLWRIVNEFIRARQDGEPPMVQVALFEYGNSGLSAQQGWIRKVSDFTTDLDGLSEKLFALRTNGGEEFCGWVIRDALDRLEWNPSKRAYKAIFIAGNEPFTQGPVDYSDVCKAAHDRGIYVNTIHCGTSREGIDTMWADGARLAHGKYLVIDQNRATPYVECPQDKELAELSSGLNRTYVAYGTLGGQNRVRQEMQDRNAVAASPAAVVARSFAKSSANYRNNDWDLVDASKQADFKLEAVKTDDLPAEMKAMNEAERKDYLAKKTAERERLQVRIKTLTEEREKFAADKLKAMNATNTLDTVVVETIREQANSRDFSF